MLFFIVTVHDNDLDNDLLSLFVFHFDPRTFLYSLLDKPELVFNIL